MEQPLSRLETFCFAERYLILELAEQRYRELLHCEMPIVFLCDRDANSFIAGFIAACSVPCQVFLCNPDWGKTEWQQVFELVQPTVVWGLSEMAISSNTLPNSAGLGNVEVNKISLNFPNTMWDLGAEPHRLRTFKRMSKYTAQPGEASGVKTLIMIPTGGTSGTLRFATHTWETLTASVQGFCQYFDLDRVHSFCVLPLYHVSGLMQFLRSFLTQGTFVLQSWKHLDTQVDPQDFFISLVPTQLQQLMHHADWLAQFKTILLGGAPAWVDLLQAARDRRLPIAPTYGMTETAAQIATLKPADFLNGVQGCGRVLPHAEITIVEQKLRIRATSLMLGYYPHGDRCETFEPDDLGYFDDRGYLHLIGRDSNKIISGGENIFPAEVESAIRSTQLVRDIHILGTPDAMWGQSVTAIYVPCDPAIAVDQIKAALKLHLASFKIPKQWISVEQIPRSIQGKIQRDRIQEIVSADFGKRSDS